MLVSPPQAVENMRQGMDPTSACQSALKRVGVFYPSFQGALLCLRKDGAVGAAAWGWTFTYSIADPSTNGTVTVVQVCHGCLLWFCLGVISVILVGIVVVAAAIAAIAATAAAIAATAAVVVVVNVFGTVVGVQVPPMNA